MIKIKTPASTSNLGIGFDCLGLAFNIYNTFSIEKSDVTSLTGIKEEFNNDNNLFLLAYKKAAKIFGKEYPIHVDFETNVPISRGLGSSSTFITGGIVAAYILNKDINIDKDIIFKIAAEFEGHPDNVAPCIYGGLSASSKLSNNEFITHKLPLSDKWHFSCLIPDLEVSTEEARKVLPSSYPKEVAVNSISKAILSVEALKSGDLELLKQVNKDEIHEPYRKALIPDFNKLEDILKKKNDGLLLISGSGSTCLYISNKELIIDIDELSTLENSWQVISVEPELNGTNVEELI